MTCAAAAADGSLLVTGAADGTARVWALDPAGPHGDVALRCTLLGHTKAVTCIELSTVRGRARALRTPYMP